MIMMAPEKCSVTPQLSSVKLHVHVHVLVHVLVHLQYVHVHAYETSGGTMYTYNTHVHIRTIHTEYMYTCIQTCTL